MVPTSRRSREAGGPIRKFFVVGEQRKGFNMASYRNRNNPDDEDVLRDGQVLRVPTHLMDSLQRSVASARDGTVFDASLHRPGFRAAGQASDDARTRAYDEMCRDMADAWKSDAQRIADTARAAEPPLCEDARENAYLKYKKWLANAWRDTR
jgi:hypothetical protein